MATLIARLAGPLQAWGAETRFRVVTTHDTPTWSGLLGLCRAALGHGRHDDPAEVAWLRQLTMAVRVDQPGHPRLDYHTINPLPNTYLRFNGITESDLGLVPRGRQVASSGRPERWTVGRKARPLTTRRAYLHDAVFVWFVGGDRCALTDLAHALTHPRWALGLGRKSCPPSSPLLLGIHPGGLEQAAQAVPVLRRGPRPAREHPQDPPTAGAPEEFGERALVWLNWTATAPAETTARVLLDDPAGAHPQDGYAPHTHLVARTRAPVLNQPWHALLDWASDHLTQPDEETTR